MRITQDDIEKIIINELGQIMIILKEDYTKGGERARLFRRIMEARTSQTNTEEIIVEAKELFGWEKE